MLLNVPLATIHKRHQEGAGPPGYQMAQGEPLPKERRGPVVGGARGNAVCLPKRLWWDLQAKWVHDG
jgi:hypothetical protein